MQYFKHQSNMRNDLKIKRVISKFGLEGYGLYNLIIESITESLSTDSPLPDLQENCEDIAEFYNGNTAKVNEMMNFMINQGLFNIDEITGSILCNKVYKFLDTSQTRSEKLRLMISNYKTSTKLLEAENHDRSQHVSDSHRQNKTCNDKSEELEEELEKNKKKNKEGNKSPSKIDIDFDLIYLHYPSSGKKGKTPALKKYKEYRRLESVPDNQTLIDHIEESKKTKSWQEGYVPHFSTWMNQRRWEDEIDESEIVLTEEEQRAEIRREIEERRARA